VIAGLLIAAGHLCVGTVMADEDKTRIILITPIKKVDAPAQPSPLRPKSAPLRSEEELKALALRIAENSELMQRFRSAVGSNDERLTGRVMHEVREYAQSLDPSVTFSEGTRLALVLLNSLGPVAGLGSGPACNHGRRPQRRAGLRKLSQQPRSHQRVDGRKSCPRSSQEGCCPASRGVASSAATIPHASIVRCRCERRSCRAETSRVD
jgi:hypothetical protein